MSKAKMDRIDMAEFFLLQDFHKNQTREEAVKYLLEKKLATIEDIELCLSKLK